jgi:hypothetical protein
MGVGRKQSELKARSTLCLLRSQGCRGQNSEEPSLKGKKRRASLARHSEGGNKGRSVQGDRRLGAKH